MTRGCQRFDGLEQATLPPRPLHRAIGMFDGVHLGHRAVIDLAVQSARRDGGIAAVLTFWPHPSALFRPNEPTKLMLDTETRVRLLCSVGVEAVIMQHFTAELAGIEAEEFLPFLLRHLPKLNTVYVGENWRFGHGRRGDIAMLVQEARKHRLMVMSAARINENGAPISSTRIRVCLEAGGIEEANTLLGYTYFAEGTVQSGKRLGRKLGFPTLNLAWEPEARPRFGVYAVQVSGAKSAGPHSAVANYGLRPTVEQSTQPRLEVHLLGDCPFDVGDKIKVDWLRFLRGEEKFSNVAALQAQIADDRLGAKKYFEER